MRTNSTLRILAAVFALVAGIPSLSGPAAAQERVENLALVPDPRVYVGYDQKLGESIPPDLTFTDESGKPVRLLDFASDRPLVLALVYYSCPRLCTEVLNGSVRMLRAMDRLSVGTDFQFVAVSIDPRDTPDIASRKRDTYLEALGSAGRADGWHFLTGDQASITRLARTVGFRYVWDEHSEQYAHDGGVVVVTPEGKISHYFFGVEFSPLDVRLALVAASKGKIGNIVDHILLLCLHYDPVRGKYGLWIIGALRIAGVLTVAALALFMLRSIRNEKRLVRPTAQGAS
jgi:protein SCO1/2